MFVNNLIRKDRWPLHVATIVFIVFSLVIGEHLLKATGGVFSLPHDEAYLQLSTAKTIAFRQVWGIGRHNFVAASPSLLYPLVLAVTFFIFGPHLIIVPIINSIIAIALLTYILKWLVKKGIASLNQLFILLAVIILSPLPAMVIYGIESPLLLLLAFLFVSRLIDEWRLPEFSRRTLIYGALMVAARYDGVLLVGGICLLLLWRRKWLTAFELALWCLLPVLVFGFISLFKGGYFLPNLFIVRSTGSLLRYDWLVGCGIAIVVPKVRDVLTRRHERKIRFIVSVPVVVIVLALMVTNLYAVQGLDRSTLATYKMNYPIAQFAHRYYYRYGITSDDVGMISFLTDGRYLDLSGLASSKVTRRKIDHFLSPGLVGSLSKEQGSRVAIISNHYDKALPGSWIKMASWEMPNKEVWSFYAIDSLAASYLKRYLDEYTSFLPPDVNAHYFYSPPPEKKEP